MITTIEHDFKIGDSVHVITKGYKRSSKPCDCCDETSAVTIKGAKYTCPKCGGRGCLAKLDFCWSIWEGWEIADITFGFLLNSVQYSLTKPGETMIKCHANHVFSTREEAQAWCDELNATPIDM